MFGKVKGLVLTEFRSISLKFSVLTGEELYKILRGKYFLHMLARTYHLLPKNLMWVSGKPQILYRKYVLNMY